MRAPPVAVPPVADPPVAVAPPVPVAPPVLITPPAPIVPPASVAPPVLVMLPPLLLQPKKPQAPAIRANVRHRLVLLVTKGLPFCGRALSAASQHFYFTCKTISIQSKW
jgi:hypothetical protein